MTRFLASFALTLAVTGPALAQDQPVCMAAPALKASLVDWYQERPAAGQKGKTEQLWVSARSGTWTVVRFLSDGKACVIAQGKNWQAGLQREELIAALQD